MENFGRVPVHVLALREGPAAGRDDQAPAGFYGSVMPAVWSFALALRSRGLGSVWTTLHLAYEREVAELLGIPATVTQVALLPVAYTDRAGLQAGRAASRSNSSPPGTATGTTE